MQSTSRLAVEVTKGEDFLNIWVDANNNGVRDDDDVNIYVTKSGGFFTESPTFKQALDAHLQQKLKEAAIAMMEVPGSCEMAEENICQLALELVLKATRDGIQTQPALLSNNSEAAPVAMWRPLL